MSHRSSLPGRPRSIGRLASLTSLLVLTGETEIPGYGTYVFEAEKVSASK